MAATEPQALPQTRPDVTDVHDIRHGYNLADIDRLARAAVAGARARAMDARDRYDAAWHTIAELLYTSATRPEPWELKWAGATAIDREGQDNGRHWGVDRANPELGYEA